MPSAAALSMSSRKTTPTTATLRSSVTATAAPTTSSADSHLAHWRLLLKRSVSMQAGASDVSRALLRKKSPPTAANSKNSNSPPQHTRRQSSQVADTLHANTTTHIHSPVLPTARSGSDSVAYSSTVAGPPYDYDDSTHPAPSHAHQSVSQPRYSVSDHSPTDLLGQRFDSLSVINSFDKISYGSQNPGDAQPRSQSQSQPHSPALASAFDEPSSHRPAHPQHSSSTFSGSKSTRARAASRLDQALVAAGRRMEDLNARGGDSGARSPRQRYSDEARETNKLKKKSGFSSFMNNLVGTPRKPTISAPENPVHVTHVGYDQNTGEFTVCLSPFHGIFAYMSFGRFSSFAIPCHSWLL
jgi:p21-activated kinase 1